MHARRRGRRRLWMGMVVMVIPWVFGGAAVGAAARTTSDGDLRTCRDRSAMAVRGQPRLTSLLDPAGRLTAHRLEIAGHATSSTSLGRIAFLNGPFGDRWVFGDARRGRSHVRVLNAADGCLETEVEVDGLVFSASVDPAGTVLVHDLVDPLTRAELGVWRRAIRSPGSARRILQGITSADPVGRVWVNTFVWGPAGELAAQSCGDVACVTRIVDPEGRVDVVRSPRQGMLITLTDTAVRTYAAGCHGSHCPTMTLLRALGATTDGDPPRVDPRPVPEHSAATWDKDEELGYRWIGDPSGWVRRAVMDAADDVRTSRGSRAAVFEFDPAADDTIGLQAHMTGPCAHALACVSWHIPHWWYIRIRPHGTEVNWGTVRWCQAYDDPPAGCYDLELAMIHEFGHVEGLGHPEDYGFRLGVLETVMGTSPPQRPNTGWNLHRFGPCDVARLQRRYDVSETQRLAVCDRVETRLTIEASHPSVPAYQPVTITATLRVKDLDSYDRLGGNGLSARDVIIERRPLGHGSWIAYEPDPGAAPGAYVLTFRPGSTMEFRASFQRPDDDGVTAADSSLLTVPVTPCSQPPCPNSALVVGPE